MFEKSKSAITFKEFQNKLNEVNNFENDWGHFYDPDNNNSIMFQDNLFNLKKREIKKENKLEDKIEIKRENNVKIKIKKVSFIDIEKLENPEKIEISEYDKEDEKNIIESVFECIKTIFITFTIVYFIVKII